MGRWLQATKKQIQCSLLRMETWMTKLLVEEKGGVDLKRRLILMKRICLPRRMVFMCQLASQGGVLLGVGQRNQGRAVLLVDGILRNPRKDLMCQLVSQGDALLGVGRKNLR